MQHVGWKLKQMGSKRHCIALDWIQLACVVCWPDLDLWLQGSQWQGGKRLGCGLPQVPLGVRLRQAGLTAQQLSNATVPLLRLPASLQRQAGCSLIHLTEGCFTDHVQVLHTRDSVDSTAPPEVRCDCKHYWSTM